MATKDYSGIATQDCVSSGHFVNGNQSAIVIHSTANYGLFRFSDANRPIDAKHLNRLIDAIAEKNMLANYPILVTSGMVVIDGQHRLKAAEHLRVAIYYKIANDMTVADIGKINDKSKKWSFADYLHYWCALGNSDYLDIAAFAKRNPEIPINFIASYLCSSGGSQTWSEQFRAGEATIRRLPKLERVVAMARDFREYIPKHWRSKVFLYAIQDMTGTEGYDHETMMKRLSLQSTRLVPCLNADAYLVLLSDIYNYRVKHENRLDFVDTRRANRVKSNRETMKRSQAK